MIQRQTLVQDEKQQEQYEASVEVEDAEETADAAQENSLMLVRGMVDDDMEHIADMKSSFPRRLIRSCACTMRRVRDDRAA